MNAAIFSLGCFFLGAGAMSHDELSLILGAVFCGASIITATIRLHDRLNGG